MSCKEKTLTSSQPGPTNCICFLGLSSQTDNYDGGKLDNFLGGNTLNEIIQNIDKKFGDILLSNGIINGLSVTNGSTAVKFSIASGKFRVNQIVYDYPGGTDQVTIPNGDSTNDRIDLIVIDAANTPFVIAGTPSANPSSPTLPANTILLSLIFVPANYTSTSEPREPQGGGGTTFIGLIDTPAIYNPSDRKKIVIVKDIANPDSLLFSDDFIPRTGTINDTGTPQRIWPIIGALRFTSTASLRSNIGNAMMQFDTGTNGLLITTDTGANLSSKFFIDDTKAELRAGYATLTDVEKDQYLEAGLEIPNSGSQFTAINNAISDASTVGTNVFSSFIGTRKGKIKAGTFQAAIIGNENSSIGLLSHRSVVIGGKNHTINNGITDSLILGGTGQTASISGRVYITEMELQTGKKLFASNNSTFIDFGTSVNTFVHIQDGNSTDNFYKINTSYNQVSHDKLLRIGLRLSGDPDTLIIKKVNAISGWQTSNIVDFPDNSIDIEKAEAVLLSSKKLKADANLNENLALGAFNVYFKHKGTIAIGKSSKFTNTSLPDIVNGGFISSEDNIIMLGKTKVFDDIIFKVDSTGIGKSTRIINEDLDTFIRFYDKVEGTIGGSNKSIEIVSGHSATNFIKFHSDKTIFNHDRFLEFETFSILELPDDTSILFKPAKNFRIERKDSPTQYFRMENQNFSLVTKNKIGIGFRSFPLEGTSIFNDLYLQKEITTGGSVQSNPSSVETNAWGTFCVGTFRTNASVRNAVALASQNILVLRRSSTAFAKEIEIQQDPTKAGLTLTPFFDYEDANGNRFLDDNNSITNSPIFKMEALWDSNLAFSTPYNPDLTQETSYPYTSQVIMYDVIWNAGIGTPFGKLENKLNGTLTHSIYTDEFKIHTDLFVEGDLRHTGTVVGFYGAGVAKQTIVGSRGGNVALENLLIGLSGLGLITNSTTA